MAFCGPGKASFHRRKSPDFRRFSTPGRGGRGSNHRDPSELAPFPNRPRSRAIARVEMPPAGVDAAGKPLGLTETGSRELGATTGWRRHINGMGGRAVHVEPWPEFVKSQSPARVFTDRMTRRRAIDKPIGTSRCVGAALAREAEDAERRAVLTHARTSEVSAASCSPASSAASPPGERRPVRRERAWRDSNPRPAA